MIYRGRLMVDRLWLMVDRLWLMVDRFWLMICWSWRMVGFLLRIVGCSLIGHFSHISIVMVSCVLDMLDATIWKLDRVGATHNIAVTSLPGPEVGCAVIICHCILIAVGLRGVLLFMVNWFGLMVDRFRFMVDRLWFMVDWFGCMVDWLRFVVDRFWRVDWFWWWVDRFRDMVCRGGGVVDWRGWGVVDWRRGMVGGGGMNSGMVHRDMDGMAEAGVTV